MKRRVIALALILFLSSLASAQSYAIRVAFNTNLRASYSLESAVLSSARAGTTLQVVGQHGRWLRVQRDGTEYWMASWVRHERVEQTQTQQQQTNIDNCCFVDRQCATDQEWVDGYWAFQNGQCTAPVQTQTQTQTQPVSTTAPAGVDNCCQVNRQCHSDDDWARGYHDYRDNQCQGAAPVSSTAPVSGPIPEGVDNCCRVNRQCHTAEDWDRGWAAFRYFQCSADIPMQIEGSSTFVSLFRQAYNRLKELSPRLYHYGITGFDRIRQVGPGNDTGILIHERTFVQAPTNYITSFAPGAPISEGAVVEAVGAILHEACHVHMWDAGTATTGWRNELPCMQAELEGYRAVDPDDTHGFIAWAQDIVINIQNPAYWWWTD